eukprot:scaffold176_cov356-Prasinococcus_capsulatus_cf.AAC.4
MAYRMRTTATFSPRLRRGAARASVLSAPSRACLARAPPATSPAAGRPDNVFTFQDDNDDDDDGKEVHELQGMRVRVPAKPDWRRAVVGLRGRSRVRQDYALHATASRGTGYACNAGTGLSILVIQVWRSA